MPANTVPTVQYLPIEILANGQPHAVVDVPIMATDEITRAVTAKAERFAFWAVAAQRELDLDEITARYAPELAEVSL